MLDGRKRTSGNRESWTLGGCLAVGRAAARGATRAGGTDRGGFGGTMAAADAPPSRSIVLRAPQGEVDWTLIELQGSIEARNGATTSLDGVEFGTLVREVRAAATLEERKRFLACKPVHPELRVVRCVQEAEAPKLVMGKMQIEGELVKLKKPLAIMTLVKPEDGSTEYHAAGVVRQKIVFKTRPVPIIVKAAAPAGSSLCGTKRTRADPEPEAAVAQ